MRKLIRVILCVILISAIFCTTIFANDENTGENDNSSNVAVTAPSAILMEASTETILFEKNDNEALPPASVTKVMTLLLIFDALKDGRVTLDDDVTVSEHAASMGGSQVFLEPGESQTLETMIKCISIASANDACVAVAEYLSGSEEAFVDQMNERAKNLGMEHTHFVNCNGLDIDGHVTSAKDIALMSRELITKYPDIHKYCMTWMENITHKTKKGESIFGLTNTNKLVRQYEYATGLKTGSTDLAKFCVSATAKKNDVELIAVIMAAPDSKTRFLDAVHLLNYGFGKCQIYQEHPVDIIPDLKVANGQRDKVPADYANDFSYVILDGSDPASITSENQYDAIRAPIKKGQEVGKRVYYLNKKKIGEIPIIAKASVKKASALDYFEKAFRCVLPVKMVE